VRSFSYLSAWIPWHRQGRCGNTSTAPRPSGRQRGASVQASEKLVSEPITAYADNLA
jgi:hypothetical protein